MVVAGSEIRPRFAINHMAAPQLTLEAFFALARAVGLTGVEIRNDIAGRPLADGTGAGTVKRLAEAAGVEILTINALQRFDRWGPERAEEAAALAATARECGAAALILVPTNDGRGPEDEEERHADLVAALAGLKPILEANGIIGLVEPLGFATSSLRFKREAVAAIAVVRGEARFRLTHDTFHHRLAGERDYFPAMTGLVHVSGVEDPGLTFEAMRDRHRVLVGPADRLGNVDQLKRLFAGGYSGPVSFEPFAAELRELADPARAIADSMAFIEAELKRAAA